MLRIFTSTLALALAVPFAACAGEPAEDAADAAAAPAAEQAPAAADADFTRLTAAWDAGLLDRCGRTLREALGTRDLVKGAMVGLEDPDGLATDEIADARHWIQAGDSAMIGVEPTLEQARCDGEELVALDEAIQFYVKAGTAAMQARSMVGG